MMALAMAVELIVRLDDPCLLGLLRPDHHHPEVRDMAVVLTLLYRLTTLLGSSFQLEN